jgi:hypothetical protein
VAAKKFLRKINGVQLIIATFLLGTIVSACATVLNGGTQKISIRTDNNLKVVSVDSSLKIFGDRSSFYVERSRNPLKVNIQTDTSKKQILIQSHNSVAYWANIYFNYGIGMLIDRDRPGRYSYPKRIYLHIDDKELKINRFEPISKGAVTLHFAMPYINFFQVRTVDGSRSSGGFWGLEGGIDYYYRNNSFLSLYAGAATDFFVPVPAAVDIWGEYQTSSGFYASVRDNKCVGSFSFGYGLAFSKLLWRKSNTIDSTFVPQSHTNSAIGLSLASAYRFGEYFQLGLLYQPYFIRIDNRVAADYQHQVSLELIVKVPVRRGNNKERR